MTAASSEHAFLFLTVLEVRLNVFFIWSFVATSPTEVELDAAKALYAIIIFVTQT